MASDRSDEHDDATSPPGDAGTRQGAVDPRPGGAESRLNGAKSRLGAAGSRLLAFMARLHGFGIDPDEVPTGEAESRTEETPSGTEEAKSRPSGAALAARAAPIARHAVRMTSGAAKGAFGLAANSLAGLRRSRPKRPETSSGTEIGFPVAQFRPASLSVESIYQPSVGSGARIVAVIGAESGDGASVVARALAERSSLSPSRTLLVDASESRDGASPLNGPGLENVGWFRLIDGEEEPFRLRSPEFLRGLWTEAHKDWETIIIDCGPAIEDRDYAVPGRLVARSADAVILVCLGGRTTRDSITAAKAAIEPANIVGVVVNGRDMPTVGAEIAREAGRVRRILPRFSRWLATKALRSKLLDVPS